MEVQLLLVLGAPRSGTTLLTAMIGCHGDVAMLNEDLGAAAKKIVGKRVVGNKLCIPNQIEVRSKRPRWVQYANKRLFHTLHRWGYFQYRPEGRLSIEDYLEWGATKMIGIVRDGNSVVASIQDRGSQPFEVAAYRWCRSIEALTWVREHYMDRLLLISFEQLVREPEHSMRAVASFLDLEFERRMLDGFKFTRAYPNEEGIDPQRAVKNRIPGGGHDMSVLHPEVDARYQELLRACNGKHWQRASQAMPQNGLKSIYPQESTTAETLPGAP